MSIPFSSYFNYIPSTPQKPHITIRQHYRETHANQRHPNYKTCHFLLSFRWNSPRNGVKTLYLDNIFEKTYPRNYSEPNPGLWWYSFQDNIKLYFKQVHQKFSSKLAIHPSISTFLSSVMIFSKNINLGYQTSTSIRIEIKDIFYYIFELFNECMDRLNTDFDIIQLPNVKPRHIDLEAYERDQYVKNNQALFKQNLPCSNPPKRRGRPPKPRYSHPSLYGY